MRGNAGREVWRTAASFCLIACAVAFSYRPLVAAALHGRGGAGGAPASADTASTPGAPAGESEAPAEWQFLWSWDDDGNYLENDLIVGPLPWGERLRRMFTESKIAVYEPLSLLAKALLVAVVGGGEAADPVAVRLLGAAAHAVSAFFVCLVTREVLLRTVARPRGRADGGGGTSVGGGASGGRGDEDRTSALARTWRLWASSTAAGLAYAVHPLAVEVVGWPSAVPYAMCGACAHAAVYTHLRLGPRLTRRGDLAAADAQRVRPQGTAQAAAGRHTAKQQQQQQQQPHLLQQQETDVEEAQQGEEQEGRHTRGLVATCALYACAVLFKSAAVPLPVALLALDYGCAYARPCAAAACAAACAARRGGGGGGGGSRRSARCACGCECGAGWSGLASFLRRDVRRLWPLLVVMLLLVGVTIHFNEDEVGARSQIDFLALSPAERLIKACAQLWTLLGLAVCPVGLRAHYRIPEGLLTPLDATSRHPGGAVAVAATALAALLSWHLRRRRGEVLAACGYIAVMMAPTLGVMQHGTVVLAADRYAYLPLAALAPLAGAALYASTRGDALYYCDGCDADCDGCGGGRAAEAQGRAARAPVAPPVPADARADAHARAGAIDGDGGDGGEGSDGEGGHSSAASPSAARGAGPAKGHGQGEGGHEGEGEDEGTEAASGGHPHPVATAAACTLVVLALLSWLTGRQLLVWRTNHTLWRHGVAVDAADWRTHGIYAEVLVMEGNMEEARVHMRHELQHLPRSGSNPKAALERGKLQYLMGSVEGACATYRHAAAAFPSFAEILSNVGVCALREGRPAEAEPLFVRAAALLPNNRQCKSNLASFREWQAGGLFRGALAW